MSRKSTNPLLQWVSGTVVIKGKKVSYALALYTEDVFNVNHYLIYNWQFEGFLKNLTCNSRGVQLDACKVQQKVQYPNYGDVRSECTCTKP